MYIYTTTMDHDIAENNDRINLKYQVITNNINENIQVEYSEDSDKTEGYSGDECSESDIYDQNLSENLLGVKTEPYSDFEESSDHADVNVNNKRYTADPAHSMNILNSDQIKSEENPDINYSGETGDNTICNSDDKTYDGIESACFNEYNNEDNSANCEISSQPFRVSFLTFETDSTGTPIYEQCHPVNGNGKVSLTITPTCEVQNNAISVNPPDNKEYLHSTEDVKSIELISEPPSEENGHDPGPIKWHIKPSGDSLTAVHNFNPLKCLLCDLAFTVKKEFRKHMKMHLDEGVKPYKCPACDNSYKKGQYLAMHIQIHSGDSKLKCEFCGKCFPSTQNLKLHRRTHTGEKPYKCEQCERSFTFHSGLKQHTRIHTGEKPFSCEVCSMSFTQLVHIKAHMKKHTGEKAYRCFECGKCFAEKPQLKQHFRTHTGEKPYKCSECGKCFAFSSSLRTHIRSHTGERPYPCEHCEKRFFQKEQLKSHFNSIHSGIRPFACNQCEKTFSDKCILYSHLRTHTNIKPHSCDVCGKSFRRKYDLKGHTKTHTKEQPFKCEICDKTFSFVCNLRTHMKLHSGEKSYKCEICARDFQQKNSLTLHLLTHTGEKPFPCSECEKSFSSKYQLKGHTKREHGDEKEFKCEVCSKTFSYKCSFKLHMRIHQGDRPFVCMQCGRAFVQKVHMVSHLNKCKGKKAKKTKKGLEKMDDGSGSVTVKLEPEEELSWDDGFEMQGDPDAEDIDSIEEDSNLLLKEVKSEKGESVENVS